MPWMHAYSHNATSSCGSVASRPATPSRAWIGSQKRDRSSFSTTAITRRTGWLGPTRSSGHCTHHRHLPAFRSPQAHRWLRFLHFRCCVSRAHAFAYSSHPGGKPHEKSNSASKKSQALRRTKLAWFVDEESHFQRCICSVRSRPSLCCLHEPRAQIVNVRATGIGDDDVAQSSIRPGFHVERQPADELARAEGAIQFRRILEDEHRKHMFPNGEQ